MRFLHPDLYPTCKLPLRLLESYSERLRFPSRNILSAMQRSESSAHDVTAHPQSHRRYLYLAISRGPCTWQGVTP